MLHLTSLSMVEIALTTPSTSQILKVIIIIIMIIICASRFFTLKNLRKWLKTQKNDNLQSREIYELFLPR